MRRGMTRWVIASLLVVLGAAFPAAGLAVAAQNGEVNQAVQGDSQGIEQRDREFLTVIRFANLWEIPMGKLGSERGSTEEVRTAGKVMLSDHTKLQTAVEQFAEKYDVPLPDKPSSSQQSWIAEISSQPKGEEFDKVFANRLRAAHGTVFNLIAEERAGTNNKEMRDFATSANTIVMKHMTLLEATGHVSPDLGEFSEASARTTAYPENRLDSSALLQGGVAFAVVAVGTVLLVRMLSARGAAK
jgi:putative membrane protein